MSFSQRVRRAGAAVYPWRPPVGWWRLRGRAVIEIQGQRLVFPGIAGSPGEWWALQARRGRWEAPVVAAFASEARSGDVVYDIGAWIGPFTLLASRLVGPDGHVYAFEPDPVARRQLERNLAANAVGNVTVVPYALTASEGTARLSGGGSEARIGAAGEHEVTTRTLQSFIAENRAPDLFKVDIEGGELGLDRNALAAARAAFLEIHVPAFRAAGQDPQRYLDDVAQGRPVAHLEGDEQNFNVRVG